MLSVEQQSTINEAINILGSLYQREDLLANDPQIVMQYCQLQIGHLEHEVFGVLFLDTQLRLIKFEQIFRGTLNTAPVYPREIAKEALLCNAHGVIFTHNHPSNETQPSHADKAITEKLVNALALFDIRVFDHIIASKTSVFSFATSGLL